MSPYLISAAVFAILCLFCGWMSLRSYRRRFDENQKLNHLWSLEILARKAKSMDELNAVIDSMLGVPSPHSNKVETKMSEICAYISGRKDGRP